MGSFLFSFGRGSQAYELLVPKSLQIAAEIRQHFRTRSVEAPGARASLGEQPRVHEHAKVLGDRWSGDLEMVGDVTRRQLAVTDELKDLSPPWLHYRAQRLVKHPLILAYAYEMSSLRISLTRPNHRPMLACGSLPQEQGHDRAA